MEQEQPGRRPIDDTSLMRGLTDNAPPSYLIDLLNRMEADEQLADHVGGWLWRTDGEHRFVHMSPTVAMRAGRPAEWHYGKTRQEIRNVSLADPKAQQWMGQLGRREMFGPVEFVRVQNGQELRMRTAGRPMFDKRGLFEGYAGIAVAVKTPAARQDCRRRWPRTRVMQVAEVATSDGQALFCVIEDICKGGARLTHCPSDVFPDRFQLKREDGRARRPCEVRWRHGNSLGVRFLQ